VGTFTICQKLKSTIVKEFICGTKKQKVTSMCYSHMHNIDYAIALTA